MSITSNEDTVTRVYDAIKQNVIQCVYDPGDRLNIERIADSLSVSATPVRETFNRLVAEELLELVPRIGFFMRPVVEGAVRELYELNFALLNWAIEIAMAEDTSTLKVGQGKAHYRLVSSSRTEQTPELIAAQVGKMFHNLCLYSGNHELLARIDNINDRLFYIRKVEASCSEQQGKKIEPLMTAIEEQDYENARGLLSEYHNESLLVLRKVVNTLRMRGVKRPHAVPA